MRLIRNPIGQFSTRNMQGNKTTMNDAHSIENDITIINTHEIGNPMFSSKVVIFLLTMMDKVYIYKSCDYEPSNKKVTSKLWIQTRGGSIAFESKWRCKFS